MDTEARENLDRVLAQSKEVDLGEGVSVELCRFLDMETKACSVYEARPLICRLLGHVEWLPCPIELVPREVVTSDALALMHEYAKSERKTLEEWNLEG